MTYPGSHEDAPLAPANADNPWHVATLILQSVHFLLTLSKNKPSAQD